MTENLGFSVKHYLAIRAAAGAKNTAVLLEDTNSKVQTGAALVSTTNEAFRNVTKSSSKIEVLIAETPGASGHQSKSIEQIKVAVQEGKRVIQQNAANAEQSAEASEQMSIQSDQIGSMVDELIKLVGAASRATKDARAPDDPPVLTQRRHRALT